MILHSQRKIACAQVFLLVSGKLLLYSHQVKENNIKYV